MKKQRQGRATSATGRAGHPSNVPAAGRSTRRTGRWRVAGASAVLAGLALSATAALPASAATSQSEKAAGITAIVQDAMKTDHLKAVIYRVTENGKPIVTKALGTSMTGVPATTAMHFRNGAVAISYMATLLLEYVDEHKVTLDDKVAKWLPDLPEANEVTLKMLANMTSGYPDFVPDQAFENSLYADPFRNYTGQDLLNYAFANAMAFPPGTNWGYAHTNYVILGEILEKVGKAPLATLLENKVLKPLGLNNTVANQNATIPSPVLHSFTSERRTTLGIPATTPFTEESTYWNPSWTLAPGSVETTNIYDMATTASAIGTGKLLSKSSYEAMTGPHLLGFGTDTPCTDLACAQQTNGYNYGLGIVRSGSWLYQDPLFAGTGATEAYLPSEKIAIAVAVTFDPEAFNDQGTESNSSVQLYQAIGAYLAPHDAPPTKR